ncbi:MAG: PilZ domain-containing protein [Lachnospiraceae bacterium]
MLISEIPPNTEITILVHRGPNSITFTTKAAEITSEEEIKIIDKLRKTYTNKFFVVVDVIKEDDNVVGFPVGNIQYILDCTVDNKPYLFNDIQINAIKLPTGSEYHIIFSDKNMAPYNRRQEYRLWLGIDGIAQLGLNRAARDVVIKDISLSGIGFVTGLDYECKIGDTARISFSDKQVDRYTRQVRELRFSVNARIVRIEEVDDKSKVIGCRIMSCNNQSNLEKYIALKQRERMQTGRNGGNSASDNDNDEPKSNR